MCINHWNSRVKNLWHLLGIQRFSFQFNNSAADWSCSDLFTYVCICFFFFLFLVFFFELMWKLITTVVLWQDLLCCRLQCGILHTHLHTPYAHTAYIYVSLYVGCTCCARFGLYIANRRATARLFSFHFVPTCSGFVTVFPIYFSIPPFFIHHICICVCYTAFFTYLMQTHGKCNILVGVTCITCCILCILHARSAINAVLEHNIK